MFDKIQIYLLFKVVKNKLPYATILKHETRLE